MTTLKAALNLAVRTRAVSRDRQVEWSSVARFKDAGARRTLFLDLKQRRSLLRAAGIGPFRDLVEAAMTTGARPGELVSLKRDDFDERTMCVTFTGKTGVRTVPISPAAVALFARLAKRRANPADLLLVRADGRPWGHSDWDELVRSAAERAKLPGETVLYTLRHSFITQALQDGMTTLDVARLVGTSLAMIEKHYGHLVVSAASARLRKVSLV